MKRWKWGRVKLTSNFSLLTYIIIFALKTIKMYRNQIWNVQESDFRTSATYLWVYLICFGWRSYFFINPLSANITKWSNTLKEFVANLSTNCLSVFEHFVRLALKELKKLCKKENWNQLRLRNSDLIYGIKFWIYQETKWWKADAYRTEPHSDLSRISNMAHFDWLLNASPPKFLQNHLIVKFLQDFM